MEMIWPLILAVLFVVILFITHSTAYRDGYKQGQADAIEGNRNVNLVQFKDGSRKWYYKSDLKGLEEHEIIK